MRFLTALTALLTLLTTATFAAASTQQTLTLQAWPLSASSPTPLAKLTYDTHTGTANSYTAPKLSSDTTASDIVRLGFYRTEGQWTGIATSASHFLAESAGKKKTVVLHVRPDGEVVQIGFKVGSGGAKAGEELVVEVKAVQVATGPVLNKPVVVDADGQVEGEKEREKSFVEKYWWVMVAFLVFQIVVGKGGDEK